MVKRFLAAPPEKFCCGESWGPVSSGRISTEANCPVSRTTMKVAMRRRPHGWTAATLLAWAGWCLLTGPALAATAPTDPGESASRLAKGFDRAALQQELDHPMAALREQPAGALRAYVQRLADLQFAMEMAVDVSPAEQRILSERILTRIGYVGLLIRNRGAGRPIPDRATGPPPPTPAGRRTICSPSPCRTPTCWSAYSLA